MKIILLLISCLATSILGGCASDHAASLSSAKPPESIEAKGRPMTAAERSAFHDVSPAAPAVAYRGDVRVECSADHQAYFFVGSDRFHVADLSLMDSIWQTSEQIVQEKNLQLKSTSLGLSMEIAYAICGIPDLLTRLLGEGNHSAAIVALAQAWCRDGSLTWYVRCGTDLEAYDVRLTPDARERLAGSIALVKPAGAVY